MRSMFKGYSSLKELEFSNFNIYNVIDIKIFFMGDLFIIANIIIESKFIFPTWIMISLSII